MTTASDVSPPEDSAALNDRPIGVFDSGLGGLTVVQELLTVMSAENIIYLGDSARVPYGIKSIRTVRRFAVTSSPRAPSPRVVPRTNLPSS